MGASFRVIGTPKNRREARLWIRAHWADLISLADMGGVADLDNSFLDEVWSDECSKIAARLKKTAGCEALAAEDGRHG